MSINEIRRIFKIFQRDVFNSEHKKESLDIWQLPIEFSPKNFFFVFVFFP